MQNRVTSAFNYLEIKVHCWNVHADTWSGDSAFESGCMATSCGLFLGQKVCLYFQLLSIKKLRSYFKVQNLKIVQPFFQKLKNDIKWIKINYGQVLIFNQCLPHGNLVNEERRDEMVDGLPISRNFYPIW